MQQAFDCMAIEAGSAGCMIAHRLIPATGSPCFVGWQGQHIQEQNIRMPADQDLPYRLKSETLSKSFNRLFFGVAHDNPLEAYRSVV